MCLGVVRCWPPSARWRWPLATSTDRPTALAGQPRGATVAFESIDGPPPGQFHQLVQNLNNEAQTRRLAVISRESPSAYRVRGYLAAKVVQRQTTIVVGLGRVRPATSVARCASPARRPPRAAHRDAWSAADDEMLHRIARSGMDQLAAFLTSPEVAPSTPDMLSVPQLVLVGLHDFTPEAAGIFRIFQPNADPAPREAAELPTGANGDPVPLPRRRPPLAAAVSARETLTLAASSH